MLSKPFRATEIAALGPWSSWSVRQLGLQVCINLTPNIPWAFLFVWFKISKKEFYIYSSTRKVWSIYLFSPLFRHTGFDYQHGNSSIFLWNQYFNTVAYIAWYNLWTWQSYQLMVVTKHGKNVKKKLMSYIRDTFWQSALHKGGHVYIITYKEMQANMACMYTHL